MLQDIDMTGYTKSSAWCGPSAVAACTGTSLATATSILASTEGCTYAQLAGAWPESVALTLHQLGYSFTPVDIKARYPEVLHGPTLRRYMNERPLTDKLHPMILNLPGHFISVHLDWAVDNWTKRVVPIQSFPKLDRLVLQGWIVQPLP